MSQTFRRWLPALALCGVSLHGCSALHVYRGFRTDMDGVSYRLPRGVLLVSVPVVRTTMTATPLTQYAMTVDGDFAGLPVIDLPPQWRNLNDPPGSKSPEGKHNPETLKGIPAPNEDQVSFRFADATVEYGVEPDPEATFFIRLEGSHEQNRALKLEFNGLGTLVTGESTVQDKRLELLLATIETATRIGTSLATTKGGPPADKLTKAQQYQAQAIALRSALRDIYRQRDEWLRIAETDHADAFQTALRGYESQADAIIAHFYSKSVSPIPFVFEIRPNCRAATELFGPHGIELVMLDSARGVMSIATGGADGEVRPPAGIPQAAMHNAERAGTIRSMRLKLKRNSAYDLPLVTGERAGGGKNAAQAVSPGDYQLVQPSGLVYRIPGAVDVQLLETGIDPSSLTRSHAAATVQLPQAGILAALPPDAGLSPENHVAIALNESTGALKSLNVESKAIDPELIRGFGTRIGESIDRYAAARAAQRTADAAKPSRLERLLGYAKSFAEVVSAYKAAGLELPVLPGPTGMSPTEPMP